MEICIYFFIWEPSTLSTEFQSRSLQLDLHHDLRLSSDSSAHSQLSHIGGEEVSARGQKQRTAGSKVVLDDAGEGSQQSREKMEDSDEWSIGHMTNQRILIGRYNSTSSGCQLTHTTLRAVGPTMYTYWQFQSLFYKKRKESTSKYYF